MGCCVTRNREDHIILLRIIRMLVISVRSSLSTKRNSRQKLRITFELNVQRSIAFDCGCLLNLMFKHNRSYRFILPAQHFVK